MTTSRLTLAVLLIVALLAPGLSLAQSAAPQAAPAPEAQAGSMLFVENAGQWPAVARFQVWGGPGTMWLAEDAIWITMAEEGQRPELSTDPAADFQPPTDDTPSHGVNLKLTFPNANPHPQIESFGRLDTQVSYFLGDDPTQWWPEVPVWSEVCYDELYPGLDLVFGDGASDALPWSLEAQPGADFEHSPPARRRRRLGGAGRPAATHRDSGRRAGSAVASG